MSIVAVSGSFDDLRSRHFRLLQEAARLGEVHALVWSDNAVQAVEGRAPKFPQDERLYVVEAIRYVKRAVIVPRPVQRHILPKVRGLRADIWAMEASAASPEAQTHCRVRGMALRAFTDEELAGFPLDPPAAPSGRKKVLVTGCYDYLHSGHVRFFEEVAEHGELYVAVGRDENITLLKGPGHPHFPQAERVYMVSAIRHVHLATVGTGSGWLDAEPELRRLKIDIYAVNEDGDKPEKREFCRANGLEYLVLKRLPRPGLPRRSSTELRGF